MVESFWELIHNNAEENWHNNENDRIVPSQKQFVEYYFSEYRDQFKDYSDDKKEGIRARVLKTYPSFVRESHFISQVQQIAAQREITSTLLIASSSLDLGMGTDLAMQFMGHSFSLNITKTDNNIDWRAIKVKRKSDVDTPNDITVIATKNNTFEVGEGDKLLWLFKEKVAQNTIEKCVKKARKW